MTALPRSAVTLSSILVLAALTACSSRHYFAIYREAIAENQGNLQQLELGMTAATVRSILGEGEIVRYKKIYLVDPWRSESFFLVDGTDVLLLFYVTQPPRKFYRAEDRDLTPIVLEHDKVVGWGWSYLRRNYERYRFSVPREQL